MTPEDAEAEYERLLAVRDDDPEKATSIERGLFTSVAMAVELRDFERAYAIARWALRAQEEKFIRV